MRELIKGYLAEMEGFFRSRLACAQERGEVPANLPVEDTSRLFLGLMLGLRVAARAWPERALLEGMTRPALALLDHPRTTVSKGTP